MYVCPSIHIYCSLAQVIKLFIAISVFFTYPLSGYVVIDIVCNQFIAQNHNPKNPHMIEYIVRILFVLLCTINAIAFPNLGPMLALVGAFSISLLNIIFPCCIELCLLYGSSYGKLRWRLIKDIMMIFIGLLILVYGTYTSIKDMVAEYGGKKNVVESDVPETVAITTPSASNGDQRMLGKYYL